MIGIEEAARRWQLADIRPVADTPGSLVYRARHPGGRSVIAKILKPRGMGEIAGMDYLAWRDGLAAVRLLAREENACLLEDAGTRTLEDVREADGEAGATRIFAAVLRQLHAPSLSPVPGGLVPLRRHFAALLEGRITMPVPLHGDLHHENILCDTDGQWRAIDPHGLIGDSAYDAANFFGNPLGRPDITCDAHRVRLLAGILAPALGCSEGKILRYAAAHAALSACWSIDDPVSDDDLGDAEDRLAFLTVAKVILEGNSS